MALLQSGDTTIGPLAFDGRTITLVARTSAFHIGDDGRGALHVRSRPHHVEVLDEDGHRDVVAVHDIERVIVVGITVATIVGTYLLRTVRRNGRRQSA
jgi:hypothetical protein